MKEKQIFEKGVTEQKLSELAEYRKSFIFKEIEKMNEENIGRIYALMLGRTRISC